MNEIEAKEIETVAITPEIVGGESGVIQTSIDSKEGIDDMLWLSEKADQIVSAYTKFRMAICKLALPGDWILFDDKGKNPKAEMTTAAAERIGSAFGVSFQARTEPVKLTGSDKLGDWYRYECECTVVHGRRSVRAWARAGSRDLFFGKAYGKWKDLSEVNEGDVKAAAIHRAMAEGVKVLFGLRRLDPEFLKANGVRLEGTSVEYKQAEGGVKDGKASEPQIKRLFALLKNGGKTQDHLKEHLKVKYSLEHTHDIERKDYEAICAWAEGKEAPQ